MKKIALVLASLLLLTGCSNGGASKAEESFIAGSGAVTKIKIGNRIAAPAMSGMTLSGKNFTFAKGKVAVVNVWASWCVTCRKEHQVIMNIANNESLKLIGINYKDQKNDGQKYLEIMGNPFDEVIFDPDGKIGMELGVYATPETFLINKEGLILYKHIGEITPEVWSENFLVHLKTL